MAQVRSKNTQPEMIVRSTLHQLGYRFRLHCRDLPGIPDLVLPKYHTALFVHGCFWHQHPGCKKATFPRQNAAFWVEKLTRNMQRDSKVKQELEVLGWKVVILWECEVKNKKDTVWLQRLLEELGT